MGSVADDQREAGRREDAALTADQRIDRAFELGEDDLAGYAAAQALNRDAARRALIRRRRVGRLHSACIESLIS
jgi:hypothetical protein